MSFVSSIPWVRSEGVGGQHRGARRRDKQTISRKGKERDERTGEDQADLKENREGVLDAERGMMSRRKGSRSTAVLV